MLADFGALVRPASDRDVRQTTTSSIRPRGSAALARRLTILQRRQRENAKDVARDDEGWCFPGIDQEDKVGPIADLRQSTTSRRKDGKRRSDGRFPVEDVHSLRRTWESIASDEGISELDQHVLSNHSFGSHNVNATYISQHIDHLAACAEKIDAGITRRIKGTPNKKRKARRGPRRLVA